MRDVSGMCNAGCCDHSYAIVRQVRVCQVRLSMRLDMCCIPHWPL
jgi:hypothetical protein